MEIYSTPFLVQVQRILLVHKLDAKYMVAVVSSRQHAPAVVNVGPVQSLSAILAHFSQRGEQEVYRVIIPDLERAIISSKCIPLTTTTNCGDSNGSVPTRETG